MKQKIPVSERALVQRINRHLAKDKHVLRKNRRDDDWWLVDLAMNAVIERPPIDLEKLGRKVGALKAYEELDKERK